MKPLGSFVAIATVVLLAGCAPADSVTPPPQTPTPSVTPSPTPTTSPTPALTDEQQAAVDALARYYDVYNGVMRRDRDPNDLYTVARGDAATKAGKSYNQLSAGGITAQGSIAGLDPSPAAPTKTAGRTTVEVSVCEDGRGWKLIDADGKDVLDESEAVLPVVATVENWPDDGWFVTRFATGDQRCG